MPEFLACILQKRALCKYTHTQNFIHRIEIFTFTHFSPLLSILVKRIHYVSIYGGLA